MSGVVVSLIAIAALSLWFFWPEPPGVRSSEPELTVEAASEASSDPGETDTIPGSLRVTVSDPRGLPLASVRVEIGDVSLETGEDGKATFAELAVRAGRVRCEHPAWGVLERDFDLDAADTLALEYEGTTSLELMVFPSGEQDATTTIQLVAIGGDEPDRVLETREIPSATPIRLEFEGLPFGRIRIEGACERGAVGEVEVFVTRIDRKYSARLSMKSQPEWTEPLEFIVTLDDRPLSRTSVTIEWSASGRGRSTYTGRTDEQGRLMTALVPRARQWRVVAELAEVERIDGVRVEPGYLGSGPETPIPLEFESAPLRSVRLLSASGVPLVGVAVRRHGGQGVVQYADGFGRIDPRRWKWGDGTRALIPAYDIEPRESPERGGAPSEVSTRRLDERTLEVPIDVTMIDGAFQDEAVPNELPSEITLPVEVTILTLPTSGAEWRSGTVRFTYRSGSEEVVTLLDRVRFPLTIAHRSSVGRVEIEARVNDRPQRESRAEQVSSPSAPTHYHGAFEVRAAPASLELTPGGSAPLALELVDANGAPVSDARLVLDLRRLDGGIGEAPPTSWIEEGAFTRVPETTNRYWLSPGPQALPPQCWLYAPSSGLASVRIDELRSGSTVRLQPTDCLTVTTRAREYQWFELHHADGSIGVGSFRPRVGGPGGRFHLPILPDANPVKLVLRGPPPPSRGAARVPRFGETPQRPVHAPGLVELEVPAATRTIEAP